MDSLRRSWELVKASFAVLMADKELIVFPIISGIGLLFVSAAFAVPMLAAGIFDRLATGQGDVDGPLTIVVGLLFYVVTYVVTFFFNSALVGAALIRLEGRDPTLGDGVRIASEHLGSILGYAVIAATVGMILRALSERAGALGKLVISIIGFAWSVGTFLVVPVLIVEGVGPVEAIKRSVALLKRTWGEQLTGNFGIGVIFVLVGIVVIVVGVIVFVAVASTESAAAIFLTLAVFVLVLIVLGLISSTLNGIFTAAVYRYAASEGKSGGFFPEELVKSAFKPKRM